MLATLVWEGQKEVHSYVSQHVWSRLDILLHSITEFR